MFRTRSLTTATLFPISQKSKLKHTSNKPLVPLHASKDPKRFRKPTPAISFSSSKSLAAAYRQQNEAVSRPVTPDVQDSAVPPKPTIGLETTKAIKSALLVSLDFYIYPSINQRFPFSRLFSVHPTTRGFCRFSAKISPNSTQTF
jgi:hypothetical protein